MLEVYDEVAAVLSTTVVDVVSKSGDVVEQLCKFINGTAQVIKKNEQYVVQGKWDKLTAARAQIAEFVKLLQTGKKADQKDVMDSERVTVDVMRIDIKSEDTQAVITKPNVAKPKCTKTKVTTFKDSKSKNTKSNIVPSSDAKPSSDSATQATDQPYQSKVNRKQSLLKDCRFPKACKAIDPDTLSKNFAMMKLESDKCTCAGSSDSTQKQDNSVSSKCAVCTDDDKDENIAASTFRICSLCDYKAEDVYRLLRHMRLRHVKKFIEKNGVVSEVLKCTKCYAYQTTVPSRLKKHQKFECTKQFSRTYQCDRCYYKTNQKEYYIKHLVDASHVGDKNSNCYCKSASKSSNYCSQDNKDTSTPSSYICETCGKQFNNSSTLKQHLTVCNISKHLTDLVPEVPTKPPSSTEKSAAVPLDIPMDNVTENIKTFSLSV